MSNIDYKTLKHSGINSNKFTLTKKNNNNKNSTNNEKVKLALKDGKEFGTISAKAYRAITNNLLDHYNPVDDEERSVLEKFKNWTGYGKTFDTVKSKYDKDKFGKGNIDLTNRPVLVNEDKTISTVDTITIGVDGKQVVIPTIDYDEKGNAKRLTTDEAEARFYKTGEHLGKFDTIEEADEYAQSLHIDQDLYYSHVPTVEVTEEEQEVLKRYGLNAETFTDEEYGKWAEAHGYTFNNNISSNSDSIYVPKYNGWKKVPTKQEQEDFEVLTNLRGRENLKESAKKYPITFSVGTVASAPVRQIFSIGENVKDAVGTAIGVGVSSDGIGHRAVENTDLVRETITNEKASKWFGGASGKLGNYGALTYNGLMSIGDMVVTSLTVKGLGTKMGLQGKALNKFASNATSGLLASNSVQSTIIEKKKEGYSDEKAVAVGVATGLSEFITEKFALDEIFKTPTSLIKKALISWGAEGFEEGASDVLSKTADYFIAGDDSTIKKNIANYMSSGMTKKNATKQAIYDSLWETASAVVVGGFSGAAMSSVYHGFGVPETKRIGKDMRKSAEGVIQKGLSLSPKTSAYTYAEKLQKKGIDKVSDYELGLQHTLNVEQIIADNEEAEKAYKKSVKKAVKTGQLPYPSAEYVGDTFVDNSTGKAIKIVSRDDTTTTVEITLNGKTETKQVPNDTADTLVVDDKYTKVETPTEETSADENATTTQTHDVNVGDVYTNGFTGVTYTVIGRDGGNTKILTEDKQGNTRVETPSNADFDTLLSKDHVTKVQSENNNALTNVYTALAGETLNSKTIDQIITTPELKQAFETITGLKLVGTKAEQRAMVRNWYNNAKNAPKSSEQLVGNEVTPSPEETVTENEIAPVVNAINETLKEGALEEIYASIPSGYEKSLDVWARKLISAYNKTGELGHIAKYFKDGGLKVMDAMDSVLSVADTTVATPQSNLSNETVVESTKNTEDVLKNQSQSATIETKTTTESVPNTDKSHTVAYTNDNQKIDCKFKVMSVDDVIASNDIDGTVNPKYPQNLQPRDRTRDASQIQITQIAANLNPSRLAESTSVLDGAPIVGPDNAVESGNGRTLAIKLAYAKGLADDYRNFIINNADKYGIDVSNLPANPILVRERLTEVDRVEFTRKANESSISSLSATEQAKVDAERLTDKILNLLVANDHGEINTKDNKYFISKVVEKVFSNEDLNNVVTEDGMLSQRGKERIRNAIFYKAYEDLSLSTRLSESIDNDMKNATNVLLNIAPKLLVVKNGIELGDFYSFDFSGDITSAVRLFEKCRDKHLSVAEYASQTSMFETEKEPQLVIALAHIFETKNRGAKQATDFYNLLLDKVIRLGSPKQESIMDVGKSFTKEEIFDGAHNEYNEGVDSEPKEIVIPEAVYRSERLIRRNHDERGTKTVSWSKSAEGSVVETASGVQRDNGRSEETGVVTDGERHRQTVESTEGKSEIREENSNEERRNDLLPDNSRRGDTGGTGKQTRQIQGFERKNQGKNAIERRKFGRELIQRGQVEKVNDGTHEYTLVKPEAYNDDMKSMVEEAKRNGRELSFFIGNAIVTKENGDTFESDGIRFGGTNRIAVRYDGSKIPQKLAKHEIIHSKWFTPKVQKIANKIIASLTDADKQKISQQKRYQYYETIYEDEIANGEDNIVWEEFVCDVMAGMNDYTVNHIGDVNTFWYGNEDVESYDPASYTTSTDAGGNKYSLSSMGFSFFGNENITSEEFEKMVNDGSYKKQKGYRDYVKKCVDVYKQSHNVKGMLPGSEVKKIEQQIEGIMKVAIAAKKAGYDIYDDGNARSVKDSKKRLLFSSLEPNSDYVTSSDVSTICDKARNFTEIYDGIVKLEEERNVPADKRFFNNVDNYFILHKLLADKGLTIPCDECYVQALRKNLTPMANAFMELVTEENSSNKTNAQLYHQEGKDKGNVKKNNAEIREKVREILSQSDCPIKLEDLTLQKLTTADGLTELRLEAPLVYEAFNSFYGQSKPKMPRKATPFRPGELTAMFTNAKGQIKTSLVNKIKATGGFRLQSYGDFQIENFVDVLQTIFEASMVGLNGHAYTKVPAFLEATEGTNLKRNISIFMYEDGGEWKLDKKNSFPMELEDIYALVASDQSGNTGIIAVSQNEDMSAWIMANELLGYGIPFHKSGTRMEIVRGRIVKTPDGREVLGYQNQKDHTKQQTEVYSKTISDKQKENTKVKKPINIYQFWDFKNKDNLSKKELIEKNVKRYIDECNKRNYRPKFREYVMDNKAVLDKVLHHAKKDGFVPQNATVEDISFKYGEYTIPYGYYKFLGDFGMFKPDGTASPIEVLSLENYDFDKAVDFFKDASKLRTNELLQQFENGKVRDEYRKMLEDGEITTEQLEDILKQKRNEVVESVVGNRYSVVVEDEETIDFLEDQEHITTYKAMQVIDGKLYPPMAAKTKGEDGKYRLTNASELGSWQQSVEDTKHITKFKEKDGETVGYYTLNKGNGKSVADVAYAPYEHSSNLVINDQFEEAYNRDNLVVVECRIPVSEMGGTYKAKYAHNATGVHDWKKGDVGNALASKGITRKVYLTRWLKPVRILSDAETATLYKDAIDNTDISIPFNVVTPSLLSELEKIGVPIDYKGSKSYKTNQNKKSGNRYSIAEESYAPTFYSQMGKVIDEMKMDKIAAKDVVRYLTDTKRGVKAEEIKWSGIEEFLEGKKSVTKAELQEFVAGSQLQIEETVLDNRKLPYSQEQAGKISEYESQRNEIFEELKREWKKAIGTEFPMQNFGLGLESSVTNLLSETNRQLKESNSDNEYQNAKEQLWSIFAEEDFGYDYEQEAFRDAVRTPREFMESFELTDEQKVIFERFISAKESFKKAEGIPLETQRHLKDIAAESDAISRKISRIQSDHTKENAKHMTKWSEYTLDGGENYREITFKMPDSTYSNTMMQTHWGTTGILAHARIQDFDVDGQKMLFIEEIQSDWHNQGHKEGYRQKGQKTERDIRLEDDDAYEEFWNSDVIKQLVDKMKEAGYENSPTIVSNLWDGNTSSTYDFLERIGVSLTNDEKTYIEDEVYKSKERHKELSSAASNNSAPDAPFKDNYHEYVLKRLLRMAAEEGYDSIGWTTADIQSKRWSDDYAEGYRIEYDQDIPKFLNKYGKKWGAKVGTMELRTETDDWYDADGTMVWSMPITDSMKNSVLYEGQTRYSLATDGILDLEDLWNDAIDKYGTIPKGEIPARDVDVPKKINEKDVVSLGARTMMEAGVTPDWAISEFEKAILDGTMTHEVITNKKAGAWAKKQIESLGFAEALNSWNVYTRDGKVGKRELALGMELYNQCITNKDVHNAMKIAAELVAEATNAGQTLQAVRMLKRMTPDGQLYYLEKSIQKMNEEFKDRLGKRFKDIELDDSLVEEFLTETDTEKRDEVYDKICQNIADQIPSTFKDKWNAWRYLAMLGNPRTHIRNILGNAIFIPAIRLKNYVGAVIEKASRVDIAERTKSLHKSKEAVEFAKKDITDKGVMRGLKGVNAKYATTDDIESKRTIFDKRWQAWIEKLRTKNFEWLEKEDGWFLKIHYVDALARLITARKIDVNSIDAKTLETLRKYAIKEAQAATYRDANAIADGLNAIQRKIERSDKKIVRASSVLLEGVMPFKKTPMNIAKQGIYYSPVGILKGIYTATTKLKKGDATVTEVIDDFAKGLTGTGMMLLGLLLANMGILVGAYDKEKKEKEFDKMVGEQDYAIKIGDFSYTIDWATPSNLSLFIGAKLYDLTKDEFSFADVVSSVSTIAEPLLELSVFSGVSGVIESAQYSDTNPIIAIGSDMITSYLMQALPTIGGQVSRIVDGSKREYYYADKNSDVPAGLQRLIGQASSKVPFASYLFEPAIDEWGREETYGNVVERAFENTVSPGYYSAENYTRVDKELRKLYEKTGDSAVLPVSQQKYYTEDSVKYDMTAEEYTRVKKLRGRKSFELVRDLISSSDYMAMTDKEKVKAIKNCYTDAGDYAKEQMIDKVKRKNK